MKTYSLTEIRGIVLRSSVENDDLPNEVFTVTAESWLLEESSDKLVIFDQLDVLLTECSSSLNKTSRSSSLLIIAVKIIVPELSVGKRPRRHDVRHHNGFCAS